MKASRRLPLIVACALFIENMDSTVLSTALPAIAHDYSVDPISLKLVLTTYLLALAVFIPVSGWVADRFGARVTFMSAIAVFLFGSVGCAISPSLEWMVLARFIQGLGDLPGVLDAVLVPNGVAAVAQCHVGDVDFLGWRHGVSSPQAATASVASRRSAMCSAVRSPALVMMSRLPA